MKSAAILFLAIGLILSGCNTIQKSQVNVASGQYEQAIRRAVENLRKNRSNKKASEFILILEEAFAKAVDRDLRQIDRLSRESREANLEQIYRIYTGLRSRQDYIRPLLPLQLPEQGRTAHFDFANYDDAIIDSKNEFSNHLYEQSKALLANRDRIDARIAYDKLVYLDELNPYYRDTAELIRAARDQGTDYVLVALANDSEQVLPQKLEADLLDFGTYDLQKPWTVYHGAPVNGIGYDFEMLVLIREIKISPEQVREKEIVQEKRIKDGYNYEFDENGNVKKDANGNDIKSDRYLTVRSRVREFTQTKTAKLTAKIEYRPYRSDELLSAFPLVSNYVFEHHYCIHNGDRRALDERHLGLIEHTLVPFPSNEQMIYESGEDIKNRLKQIIMQNRF